MAGDLSLRSWGADRLLLQQPERWEVRSWPGWQLLDAGGGTAVAEPGGDRLAVTTPDGTIRAGGPALLTLPPDAGRPTDLTWSGGSLVVAARAAPRPGSADPAGVSARPFGAPPTKRASLWRLPPDGTPPTWLYDAPPGSRIWALHELGGEVLVELYPSGEPRRPPAPPRLMVVAGDGQTRDLAPELPGACCDATVGPDGRLRSSTATSRTASWSSPPGSPWWKAGRGAGGRCCHPSCGGHGRGGRPTGAAWS